MDDSLELTPDDFIVLPPYSRTFDQLADETYSDIRYLYYRSAYEEGVEKELEAFESVYAAIERKPDLEPPKWRSAKRPVRNKVALYPILRIATAWLVLAKKGEGDAATYCLAKAQYWLGRGEQLSGLRLDLRHAQSERQKKAAKARVTKADPIREYAVSLVKDNPGRFSGEYAAAAAIEAKVLDRIEQETGKRPVAGSKLKSISRWLAHLYIK